MVGIEAVCASKGAVWLTFGTPNWERMEVCETSDGGAVAGSGHVDLRRPKSSGCLLENLSELQWQPMTMVGKVVDKTENQKM